jgi:hypothetical protein
MTENKLHNEVARAARAEHLLSDTLLSECVEKVRLAYLAAWETTKSDEVGKREQLWLSLRALEQVMNELRQVANSGKMAKISLERAYQRKEQQAN